MGAGIATRIGTSVIDAESVPWLPFSPHSKEVMVKYYKLDPVRGEVIVLLKARAGAKLPRHHHSGTLIVYTIEGRWRHADDEWIAGPGSVVFETAATRHSHIAFDEDVLTLNVVAGDVLMYGPAGELLAVENWKSAMQRYLGYCERHGVEPRDLTAFG